MGSLIDVGLEHRVIPTVSSDRDV